MVTCLESATFPARQRYLLYISGIKIVVHCSFCKKAKFVISTSSPYIFSGDLPELFDTKRILCQFADVL